MKKLVLEFLFDEEQDDFDPGQVYLVPRAVVRPPCDLTADELSALGEEVAQSDRWQVDNWIAIQNVLSGSEYEELK